MNHLLQNLRPADEIERVAAHYQMDPDELRKLAVGNRQERAGYRYLMSEYERTLNPDAAWDDDDLQAVRGVVAASAITGVAGSGALLAYCLTHGSLASDWAGALGVMLVVGGVMALRRMGA